MALFQNLIAEPGLLADRPAAGTPGRLYYATDLEVTYRDNGSSWDVYGGGGGGGGGTAIAFRLAYQNSSTGPLYGGQTVPASTTTHLLFSRVLVDTTGGGAEGANSRFVVPTDLGGVWVIHMAVKYDAWASSSTQGYLVSIIQRNGSDIQSQVAYRPSGMGDKAISVAVTTIALLSDGDIIRGAAFCGQNTGTVGGNGVIESSLFGYRVGASS